MIQNTWVNFFPPKAWSVYGQAVCTSNDLLGSWRNALNRLREDRGHIPFYILIQHLYKEDKLFAIQLRLLSNRKLQRIQRQTYRRPLTKIFDSEMTTHSKLYQQSNDSKLVVVSMDQLGHISIHLSTNV